MVSSEKKEVNSCDCRYCNIRYKTIFADLNELEMNLLSNVKKCRDYKKGEVVFKENTYPKGLYCIKDGKFKVSRIGTDQREQIIHLAQKGDVMGFRALMGEDKYNCSSTAMDEATLCFIPKETFMHLVEDSPKLSLRLIHFFSDMLKESEIKITVLGQNPVKERVLYSLCQLINKYGFENDGCTINLSVMRQELADMAGTTRETATRILFDLESEEILKLSGKKIIVIDYPLLLKSANVF